MDQEDVRRPYVDYKYYKDDYFGKQIASESDFKRIEKLAEAFVDRVTFGRIARLHSIPDCVKDAICSAADTVALREEKNAYAVKSESNDGYSVSYGDVEKDLEFRSEMFSSVKSYLANTGLLYRGWSKDYDKKC